MTGHAAKMIDTAQHDGRPAPARLRPPRLAFPVLARHRLVDAVSAGVRAAPLTLVRAPAGCGKTVLAAAWASQTRRGETPARLAVPPAWLTLDDGDDRPGAFWAHVVAALARAGAVVDGAPDPGHDIDPSFVDGLAAALSANDGPVALVLDQAERLTDPRIGGQLDHVLRAAAPRLRLVVLARAEPALPLHRYRLDGTVAQLHYEDLAFTAAEVGALLELHGVRQPELTRIVAGRTEGWAAGVRFAALAVQQRPSGAVADEVRASLEPAGSPLGDYLAAEVLDALPPAHLDFLARTSVAAELTPALAEELTGRHDSDWLLSELAHGNAFVLPVPGAAGTYRTHPLVRELLGTVLGRAGPGTAGDLHRRAARWCAGSGRVGEAVDHLGSVGDWAGAAALVVDGGGLAPLLVPGAPPDLARRLDGMPDDVGTPAAAVVQAALAVRRGELWQAARRLSRCDEYVAAAGTGAAGAELVLAVAATRTALADAVGDAGATLSSAGHLQRILQSPAAAKLDPSGEQRALGLLAAGAARLRAGDPAAACADLSAALAAAEAGAGDSAGDGAGHGCAPLIRLRCLGMLALADVSRGRLSRAAEHADAADALAAELSVAAVDRPAAAHLARAWVAQQRQDLAGAEDWLRRAVRVPECRGDTLLSSVSVLLHVRLRRDRGDAEGARHFLDRSGAGLPWVLALAGGEATDAVRRPAGIEPQAARVEQLLRQAHRQLGRGDSDASRVAVVRALELARREGLRRPFAHVSPKVRRLLHADAAVAARAGWLRRGAGTRSRAQHADGVPPVGRALSERELEVLRHLSSLLTTEEVASAMYISVNTVRTHIRGILRKLSVSRRNEAVRRARHLGIL